MREDKLAGSLSSVLFSGVQRRVLALLFGQSGRDFHGNEILKLTGSGRGALQRELRRLTESGLVLMAPVGNQKRYRANPASPIYEELRSIVRKTFGLTDDLRARLAPLSDRTRVAFVYGSVAKGTDSATSDIDLMVISDGVSYQDLLDALAEVETQLKRKISPVLYSTAEFERRRAESNDFLLRVLEQPKLFIIGDAHELGESRQAGGDRRTEGGSTGAEGV